MVLDKKGEIIPSFGFGVGSPVRVRRLEDRVL